MKDNFATEMNRLDARVEEVDAKVDQQKGLVYKENQLHHSTQQSVNNVRLKCSEHVNVMKVWMVTTQVKLKVCMYYSLLYYPVWYC